MMKVVKQKGRIYLVLLSICLVGNIIAFWIPMARAGFEEDFSQANDWDRYHGDVEYKNARLIQNVTRVLHQENMELLKQIEELKEELSELKEIVEGL